MKSIELRSPGARPAAGPDVVRSAREAAGWTQEALADLLGVLPVEIAAWESGSIALSPYEAELIRWRIQDAEYEKRLPKLEGAPCEWLARHRERFDQFRERGPQRAGWVERTIAAHQRDCPVCGRAQALLRELPPRPEPPVPPGLDHRLAHTVRQLPAWLRVPVVAVLAGSFVGLSTIAISAVTSVSTGSPFNPQRALWWGAGIAWLLFTYRLLRPLADRRPFLAGQIHAATLLVPAGLIVHEPADIALDNPFLWVMMCIFIGLIGLVLGAFYDPHHEVLD